MSLMDISVIVPAFDEASRISTTLQKMHTYLHRSFRDYEIIVVDDGSTDATRSIVENLTQSIGSLRLIHLSPPNVGKGHAIKRGVLSSRGNLVLLSDADLSTPLQEVEKLMTFMKRGYDIAIGSRGLSASDIRVRQPWYREGMGKIFNFIVRLLVTNSIADTQCGFKLFKGDVARTLFKMNRITGFSFDVEILFLAERNGYTIQEVPVQWFHAPDSKVRLIRDPFFMLIDLIKIRMFWLLKRYK